MDIDDGSAAIQFLHHGIEAGISEPPIAITRHEHDAVGVELVERVFDLTQAAFDVGQRKCSEETESFRMSLSHLRGVKARLARQASSLRHIAKPDARR